MIRQCRHAHGPRSSSSSACDQRRAAVERDVDPRDVPLAARERVAAHLDRSGRDRLAVGRRQHVGVERDQAERHARARARRAVLRQQPVDDVLEVALHGLARTSIRSSHLTLRAPM